MDGAGQAAAAAGLFVAGARSGGLFGVIDIGSNSVRLVVFEQAARNPVTLFNEKMICAIGRRMVTTGRLDTEGMASALKVLKRFRRIAESMGVTALQAVATAAARDAKNGAAFVARAAEAAGVPVQVLTGEQEAELAALGVLSGIPDADGVAGDLGGGSLELTPLSQGRRGQGISLPFGPLRLMDAARGSLTEARQICDAALMRLPGLARLKGRTLYAVGGAWRNLARLSMARRAYPLSILHGYEMDRREALAIARYVMESSPRALGREGGVARKRADTLPFGALVLDRLIRAADLSRVVISAHGVREGVLFKALEPDVRARDPLFEAAGEIMALFGRREGLADGIERFTAPLFAGESAAERRLRKAAALLSDSAWREHPDHRADLAFRYVLQAQIAGITHADRAFLALALWHRYGAGEDGELVAKIEALAGPALALRAERLGRAMRLAYVLAGSAHAIGERFSLSPAPRELILRIAREDADVRGEPVDKRLAELAASCARRPRIRLGR